MSNDDLSPLEHTAVLAALRAPAQGDELAGEAAALAMFRATAPKGRRRRALHRVSVGGVGVVIGLALTGGVAAAYTTGLPDPMQNALHSAIEPLGIVPAPLTAPARRLRHHLQRERQAKQARQERLRAGLPVAARPRPGTVAVATPSPRTVPSPKPSAPVAAPTPAPAPATSPQPTASPPPAPPATLSVAVSRRVVAVHGQVVLSGRLSRGDAPATNRHVYAAELVVGQTGWHRVADARTGSDGTVSLTLPALTGNVRLRLVSEGGVTSRQLAVFVVPKLTVGITRSQGQRVATITADGGHQGDGLVLLRRDGGTWTQLATTTLDSSPAGQFTVPGPAATRVRYRVRLAATRTHAASFVEFFVAAR